ncbi:MAG: RNA pseudouridine synthase [Rhodothermus sp.]|nr:RNA pseudouridine synthase [Rhodothermus sp.]
MPAHLPSEELALVMQNSGLNGVGRRNEAMLKIAELPVLYLDNHLLVVNKPSGLRSQGDRSGAPTVLSLARALIRERFDKPGNVYLGLVQRLDAPVSGVMVLARTSKAAARLTRQFREHTVEKVYLALVEGVLEGQGTWVDFIAPARDHMRLVPEDHPWGKRAVLRWQALMTRNGLTLVRLMPETGRKHQIRVQLAFRGYPILGDRRYRARRWLAPGQIALHAWKLSLTHPTRRERMSWMAPVPSCWDEAFRLQVDRLLVYLEAAGPEGIR